MLCKTVDINFDYKRLNIDNGGYKPTLSVILPDNCARLYGGRKYPMVVICPGGGYEFTSDREAEPVSLKLAAAGFNTAILRYSVGKAKFPAALFELASAVAMLREHADEWNIDSDKIFICGFSAGGHLCASFGTLWNRDFVKDALGYRMEEHKPNGMILCYPVITSGKKADLSSINALLGDMADDEKMLNLVSAEKQVSSDTPPAFIWHTFTDDDVPVENSLLMAAALKDKEIPFELHIFPRGPHGLSIANNITAGGRDNYIIPECQRWVDMAIRWIENL